MTLGNIILLNGTSSSGKTTIARALQDVMERPYLHTGLDQLVIQHLPKGTVVYSDGVQPAAADGWLAVFGDDALNEVRIGPVGYRWIAGMYHAVAALAQEGLDVILDDVIYDRRVLKMAVEALPAETVFFVGIRCPLEVAERREQARGDRARGGARAFYHLVHAHGIYDLEVDSAQYSPFECAMQIKEGLRARPKSSAFSRLSALLSRGETGMRAPIPEPQ
jgi:chloramphenicol 3-O phosphotransferase